MPIWAIAGHSIIGTSHAKVGMPCQDHCAWKVITNTDTKKRCAIALSDGAGSARHAETGARLTVEFVLAEIAAFDGSLRDIDLSLATGWLQKVRDQISKVAEDNGNKVSDYSATLLLALLDEDLGYFLQLGDGAWVVQTPSGIESATWPDFGEYVNETTFLTSADFAEHLRPALIEAPIYVAGFTDGLQPLLLDFKQNAPHRPMIAKLFSALASRPTEDSLSPSIVAFLTSRLVNDQVDDDKTLVLAWGLE
jgi:hypothetical protein